MPRSIPDDTEFSQQQMEIVLFIIAMIGLLMYIRWDGRRPAESGSKKSPGLALAVPSAVSQGKTAVRVCLGFALVVASLALAEWMKPSAPPYTGRYSFIKQALFSLLGERGIAGGWAILALVLVLLAIAAWRRTPKLPTDRWYR